MSIPLSQRRSSRPSLIQQTIDNGLFADSPALQQTLQSRTPTAALASATPSRFLTRSPTRAFTPAVTGTPSYLEEEVEDLIEDQIESGRMSPAAASVFSRATTPALLAMPSGGSRVTFAPEDEEVSVTFRDQTYFADRPTTASFVPRSESRSAVTSSFKRAFPVSKTADKIQSFVSHIPRYVYVLAAVVLLAGLWMLLWKHMLVQFTFGRRKGQAAKCNGKKGSTGIFQFGGAKELEHPPDWKVILGSGVPTHVPHKKDAIASVGVHAAVETPMMNTSAPAVVTTTESVPMTGAQAVATMEPVSTVSPPKTTANHILESVGIYSFN